MVSERFVYIWRYTIDPTQRSAFLAAYNPKGELAQLFSRDPSYLKTLLIQDVDDENRYVTIDYWKSKDDRDAFRERFAVEFDALDNRWPSDVFSPRFSGKHSGLGALTNEFAPQLRKYS